MKSGIDFERIISQSSSVPIDEVLNKICVSPPYFSFTEIFNYQGMLIAQVEPEQEIDFELELISSAEASRHMAILGSCAIAMEENQKKYYLSSKAEFNSYYKKGDKYYLDIPLKKKFYIVSRKVSIDRSFAVSENFLFCNNKLIFSFRVTYQVMPYKLFERVFSSYKFSTSLIEESPYGRIPKFEIKEVNSKYLLAEMPIVDKKFCAGHFNQYPMIPVGVSAYMVIDLIGELIKTIKINQRNSFIIDQAFMEVFLPISTDAKVTVKVDFIKEIDEILYFKWIVFKDELKFNEMKISFCKVN